MAQRRTTIVRGNSVWIFALLLGVAGWLITGGGATLSDPSGRALRSARRPTGSPQLVSIEPLPMMEGTECQWLPASASTSLVAAIPAGQSGESRGAGMAVPAEAAKRQPIRRIHDPYPSFSSVA